MVRLSYPNPYFANSPESNVLFRDTVCSVGVIPHTLPLTYANAAVRYFRHAIALDERRAVYQVNHWHSGNPHNHECIDAERTDVREVWFAGCHAGRFKTPLITLAASLILIVSA